MFSRTQQKVNFDTLCPEEGSWVNVLASKYRALTAYKEKCVPASQLPGLVNRQAALSKAASRYTCRENHTKFESSKSMLLTHNLSNRIARIVNCKKASALDTFQSHITAHVLR